MHAYVESWEKTWSTQVIRDFVFLTKRQFVCWFKLHEGYTSSEAETRWEKDLTGGVEREENSTGETCLKVALPKRLRSLEGQSCTRKARCSAKSGFSRPQRPDSRFYVFLGFQSLLPRHWFGCFSGLRAQRKRAMYFGAGGGERRT
jgi:hypothetical protein